MKSENSGKCRRPAGLEDDLGADQEDERYQISLYNSRGKKIPQSLPGPAKEDDLEAAHVEEGRRTHDNQGYNVEYLLEYHLHYWLYK